MRMRLVGLVILLSLVPWTALADGVGAFSAFRNADSSCLLSIVAARSLAMGGASLAISSSHSHAIWEPGVHPILPHRMVRLVPILADSVTSRFAEATLNWGDAALGLGASATHQDFTLLDAAGNPSESATWAESVVFASAVAQFDESGVLGVQLNSYHENDGLGNTSTGLGIDVGGAAQVQGQGLVAVRARDLGNTEIHWDFDDLDVTDIIAGILQTGFGGDTGTDPVSAMRAVSMDASSDLSVTLRGSTSLGGASYASFGAAYVRHTPSDPSSIPDSVLDAGTLFRFGRNLTCAVDAHGVLIFGEADGSEAPVRETGIGLAWEVPRDASLDFGWNKAILGADVKLDAAGIHVSGVGVEWNSYDLGRHTASASLRGGVAFDQADGPPALTLGAELVTERIRIAAAGSIQELQLTRFILGAELTFDREAMMLDAAAERAIDGDSLQGETIE